MYKKHEIGKLGEQLAENYLIQNHYTILEKNFMCKQGEIDIIAFGENYLVFIEVKTRSSLLYGKPIDSVNNIKQKHLYKSAKFYLYLHNLENYFVRFDVIEVYLYNNKYKINHIKQITI